MPSISVVVPTYNRANLIKKTIDSILKQTFKDFELIIISNGSTDNTQEIVESYNDNRIIYIFQQASGSPASPRNNGIRHSKGNYIAFCDDDDLWLPEKLLKQYNFLQENPTYDICYTKMKRFNETKSWINQDEETYLKCTYKELLNRNNIPLSSILIRKNILKDGFDEDKRIFGAEDYELLLRLIKQHRIVCLPEYLIKYYSGEKRYSNIISSIGIKRNLKYIIRTYWVYKKLYDKKIFSFKELCLPFLYNLYNVFKIIIYDSKYIISKRKID